jgi:predicted lipid-binding transport protein (Tim44 family)
MQERVEEVFYRVQEAWAECNQDLARDCMTNSLYERHKSQTDAMLRRGERNVLENVRLLDAQIVSVDDRDDDRKDKFWVYISGSMRDFTIIEASGEVIDGDVDAEISFNELWKFVRERNQWMLHAIEQDTSLAKLQEAKSESLPG